MGWIESGSIYPVLIAGAERNWNSITFAVTCISWVGGNKFPQGIARRDLFAVLVCTFGFTHDHIFVIRRWVVIHAAYWLKLATTIVSDACFLVGILQIAAFTARAIGSTPAFRAANFVDVVRARRRSFWVFDWVF